jgi:hypothetical protein
MPSRRAEEIPVDEPDALRGRPIASSQSSAVRVRGAACRHGRTQEREPAVFAFGGATELPASRAGP